ncbi:MAG: hypothetical protein N4A46_08585 [Schleiferiaceae bacterium]|jgi:hypothetical protein|nr:hypothetical protein [Schleiferiaceae bacterium]
MKKTIAIAILFGVFIACKKEQNTTGGGSANIKSLHERLHGTWDIVAISYSGAANLPWDTTTIRPFTGEGEEVVGYYVFDTVPDPNMMTFDVSFKAPITFDGDNGPLITLLRNEGGHGTYTVDETLGLLTGTSSVYNNTSTDTTVVSTEWEILDNQPTRQVWATNKNFYFDGDPNKPTVVRMKTTIEKQ